MLSFFSMSTIWPTTSYLADVWLARSRTSSATSSPSSSASYFFKRVACSVYFLRVNRSSTAGLVTETTLRDMDQKNESLWAGFVDLSTKKKSPTMNLGAMLIVALLWTYIALWQRGSMRPAIFLCIECKASCRFLICTIRCATDRSIIGSTSTLEILLGVTWRRARSSQIPVITCNGERLEPSKLCPGRSSGLSFNTDGITTIIDIQSCVANFSLPSMERSAANISWSRNSTVELAHGE